MEAVWIWYAGDFELYHGMLQNFQREERGYGWPAYWKMADWNKNVWFGKSYDLTEKTEFTVLGKGMGYVEVNGLKYPLGQTITCEPGKIDIKVCIGNMAGLPCIYIDSPWIRTNRDWIAGDFVEEHPAGTSSLYTEPEQDPNVVYYTEEAIEPKEILEIAHGVLYRYDKVINGTVEVVLHGKEEVAVCYGESEEEATNLKWCYYKDDHVKNGQLLRRRAFRFLFVPEARKEEVECHAVHQSVPIEKKAAFHSSDEQLNRIWEVARDTYELCSGLFFIDGIKRDRWIWSGDAYQSYFVNQYLYFDEEIDQRTIRALRGKEEIKQHLNTIVDYSLLWIISIRNEYQAYGNLDFVREIYPKMTAMMELFSKQLNDKGFLVGRKKDWIYIDWADFDKKGPLCAEQMLLLETYRAMAFCGKLLGEPTGQYEQAGVELQANILRYFWNHEKGAFVDSYESGKNHVTRHANIFAVLFGLVDEKRQEQIMGHVLQNPEIPEITTPYFKFFELDMWGKLGRLDKVFETIKAYWGGMLERNAITFWEQFDPKETGQQQYAMYGDPFGKSLCHAWAASPIYLLGRYFLGVYPTSPGYGAFAVKPELSYFDSMDCDVPVKDGNVHICYRDGKLEVTATRSGGVLILDGKESEIPVK